MGRHRLQFYETVCWEQACIPFQQTALTYPPYYQQNFHGITGGYLNPIAAITYDPVTAVASPPNETRLRQQLVEAIAVTPLQILDLGCGTGSLTLMLKQAFPLATVIGLDLSPYMLLVADYKARTEELAIEWHHGLAENTNLQSNSFDLVTVSMVFHEMPPEISRLVLQEGLRLLRPGGQLLVLDGNQHRLHHADWLIQLFREPYSKVYAAEAMDDWMKTVGFVAVETRPIGWIHQITQGWKAVVCEYSEVSAES